MVYYGSFKIIESLIWSPSRTRHHFPLIEKVIDKLRKAKYFNKLNLIWGYNNVCIKEGDKYKAAFLMNKALFKP